MTEEGQEPKARVRFSCFFNHLPSVPGLYSSDIVPFDEKGAVADPSLQLQVGGRIPPSLMRRTKFRERFLGGHPIVWIEDQATAALRPFWAKREDLWELRRLVPGQPPHDSIPRGLYHCLVAAGVVASIEERERRRAFGEAQAEGGANQFASLNYCLLDQLLHVGHLHALQAYYRDLIAQGQWRLGDGQVARRYGLHNEPVARFFHHQLADYVSLIVHTVVKPSYAYVSAYQGGSILRRHVDRQQCEFTLSILIDRFPLEGIQPWPLYFDTPGGRVKVLQEAIGEAVLFRGTILPHYREPLPEGETSTSLLLHYVPATFEGTLR
jgi:hypothetical protein